MCDLLVFSGLPSNQEVTGSNTLLPWKFIVNHIHRPSLNAQTMALSNQANQALVRDYKYLVIITELLVTHMFLKIET